MTRREQLVAAAGAALFLVSCVLVRGGLFDSARYGDAEYYGGYAHKMASGELPYRDFFDEYPVLAQPLFYVVHLLPGSFVSSFNGRWRFRRGSARADGCRDACAAAPPWRSPPASSASRRSSSAPSSSTRTTCFPALLTIAAVLAFLHDRERTAYVLLALAVAAKIYPVVIAADRARRDLGTRRARGGPARVRVVRRRARARPPAVCDPGAGRPAVQLLGAAQARARGREPRRGDLLVLDRLGLYAATLRDQAPGSRDAVGTLPDLLAVLSSLVVVAAVAWVTWLYVRGRRDRLLAAAAAVTAFVAFGKVLSPQYVVWLVPLVPAAGLAASAVFVGVIGLTHAEFNRFGPHGTSAHWGQVLSWWIIARDLVLVALFFLLALRLRAGPRSAKSPLTTRRVTRAAEKRRDAGLDVAAEHEDVPDVAMPLGLAVVRRIDAEIVRRVAGMHAPRTRERMRVARLRADDPELRLEGDAPGDPVARIRVVEVVRPQRREGRVEVRRHGDALGSERDDVVAVELDEAADRQRRVATANAAAARSGVVSAYAMSSAKSGSTSVR